MTIAPAPPLANLWQRFDEQVARDRTRPFLFFVDERGREVERLSFDKLEASAQRVAHRLTSRLGLEAGERVLLVHPPSLDFVKALLGCLMCGVVPVPVFPPNPLNLQQTMRTFAAIAEDCGAKVALTNRTYAQARWVGRLKDRLFTGARWPSLDWQRIDQRYGPRLTRRHAPDRDEVAVLQYTSGSTSAPKGVMITHQNLAHQFEYNRVTLGLSHASTSVLWVPHFHDFGLISGILNAIMGNGRLYMMSPLTFIQRPAAWLELMSEVGATHTAAPNFAYELAVRKTTPKQRASWDLSALEVTMSAAEPIQSDTVARFLAAYAPAGLRPEAFCPAYGLAEHTVGVTIGGRGELDVSLAALEQQRIARAAADGEAAKTLLACGTASMDVDLRIVDPQSHRELAEGRIGEIWVDSPSKAAGYWNRSAESETTFRAEIAGTDTGRRYLRTGDLGFMHGEQLYVCGRLKDLIIVRGRNVYPQDLESSVEACHPAIRPGCVAAFSETGEEATDAEQLVIVAELKRELLPAVGTALEATFAEIVAAIREIVGVDHQLDCREIVLIEPRTIAKTTSGKIQRARCKASWRTGALERLYVARTPTEARESAAPPTTVELLPTPADSGEPDEHPAPSVGADLLPTQAEPGEPDEHRASSVDADPLPTQAEPGEPDEHRTPSVDADPLPTQANSGEPDDEHRDPPTTESSTWVQALADRAHAQRLEQMCAFVAEEAGAVLGSSPSALPRTRPLQELGLNSLRAVELRNRLVQRLERRIPVTLAFDAPTIEGIARYLLTRVLGFDDPRAELGVTSVRDEPVAVIGMACRLPGAVASPEQLAQLLAEGIDAITEVPASRWEVDPLYDPDPTSPGKMRTRWGGFLSDIDRFDARFFGVSAKEADYLDPQQRLLLECCWEALERARVVPEQLEGTPTGVYLGLCGSEYQVMAMSELEAIAPHALLGSAHSTAAGRISYTLGLEGPSVAVDTACSSSLVAIHLACQAIRTGECSTALAGGANVLLAPHATVGFSQLGAMSPSGRCKTFAADADGYVRSEGCGIVVLKSLAAAQRDGDPILGVILGSASNQDGRSNGLSAPRGPAQTQVIRRALARAGVEPDDVGYVECHGTGTPLGDPIELDALASVFGDANARSRPLFVGSIKSNIGHTEAAAGVAGLLKVLCSLPEAEIPPSLHADRLSEHFDWQRAGLEVARESVAWPAGRRIAGVSSFGFSGTNVHLVVEAPPPSSHTHRLPSAQELELPVLLSAKSPAGLRRQARQLLDALRDERVDGQLRVADLAASLATTRTHFEHRAVILAARPEQVLAGLEALSESRRYANLFVRAPGEDRRRGKLTLLFTGQGSQRAGMGRDLYETCTVFQETLERLADGFSEQLDPPLLEVMFAPRDSALAARLHETAYTQAGLFVLEVALARLWIRWGLRPDFLLGHSIGEIAAACIAGVVSEVDGCRLVAARGRLMQQLPAGGAMASVQANEAEVRAAIVELGLLDPRGDAVSIAALNTPAQVVISGDRGAVERLMAHFDDLDRAVTALEVSHAFHSHHVDAMLDPFADELASLPLAPPKLGLISNVHGTLADGHEVTRPDYWVRHAREAVRFGESITYCHDEGTSLFVEIGPQALLVRLAQACVSGNADLEWLSSQRRGQDGWSSMLRCLAQLHLHGVGLDWDAVFEDLGGEVIDLPTYAFDRSRHWLPARRFVSRGETVGVLVDDRSERPDALLELLEEDGPRHVRTLSASDRLDGLDALVCAVDPPRAATSMERTTEIAERLWSAHRATRDASPPVKLVLVSGVPRGRATSALARFIEALFAHRERLGLPTTWVDAPPQLCGIAAESEPDPRSSSEPVVLGRRDEKSPAELPASRSGVSPASDSVEPVVAVPHALEPRPGPRSTPSSTPRPTPGLGPTPAPGLELTVDPTASGRELERQIVEVLRAETARLLECSVTEVSVHTPLTEQGFDSLLAAELRPALERVLGLRVPAAVAFDYPTILDQATYLRERLEADRSESSTPTAEVQPPVPPPGGTPADGESADDELMARLASVLEAEGALDQARGDAE